MGVSRNLHGTLYTTLIPDFVVTHLPGTKIAE